MSSRAKASSVKNKNWDEVLARFDIQNQCDADFLPDQGATTHPPVEAHSSLMLSWTTRAILLVGCVVALGNLPLQSYLPNNSTGQFTLTLDNQLAAPAPHTVISTSEIAAPSLERTHYASISKSLLPTTIVEAATTLNNEETQVLALPTQPLATYSGHKLINTGSIWQTYTVKRYDNQANIFSRIKQSGILQDLQQIKLIKEALDKVKMNTVVRAKSYNGQLEQLVFTPDYENSFVIKPTESGSFEGTQQFRLLVESSGSDIVSIGATHKVEASSGTSNAIGPHLSFSFELDQDVSSAVLKLQGKTSNTSDEAQFSAIEGAKIAVYYFPTSNETQEAITPDSANFYVEGNVSIGVGNTIQASVSSSPLAWSASSMSMEMKEGSAKIPCSGGNSPTGLTCATGDEQLGWVIDFPEAGEYEVCANSVLLSGGNHAITQRMYLMDDLTSTTLTESQRGNSIHTGGGVNTYNSATICENFKIPSRGERRFLMLYESTNTDTYIILGRDGNTSEPDLKFWARKSAHYANRPILTNQNFTYGQEIKLIDKYNGQTAYRYCNRVGLETGEADITTTTVIEAISANLNPIKSISLDGVDFILLDFTVQGSGSEYRRIVYERDTGNIHTSRDVYSLSKETVYCMDYTK